MKLFHHHTHAKYHSIIHSDFFNFELSVWLHTFAYSLISLFIPILLLQLGYSITQVLLYFIILHCIDVPLNFAARRLIIRYGARAMIVIATVATILYFFIFNSLSSHGIAILIALAAIDALYDTLYWVSHLYIFVESSGPAANAGKNTGMLSSVRSLASKLAPALGAAALLFSNTTVLISVTIGIFILSIIPLLKLTHVRDKPVNSTLSIARFFSDPREKKNYLSLFFYSVHSSLDSTLWPLFIFTLFGTIKSIGAIAVVISASSIAFSYITGVFSKKNQYALIMIGSIGIVILWSLRIFFLSELIYYVTTFLMAFFAVMLSIPLETNIVARARQKGTLDTVTIRNATTMVPQIIVYGGLLLAVGVFKVSFFVAIASLIGLLITTNIYTTVQKRRV